MSRYPPSSDTSFFLSWGPQTKFWCPHFQKKLLSFDFLIYTVCDDFLRGLTIYSSLFRPQVDKVKNLRGGCSFLSRGGGCKFFLSGGGYPPSTQKKFRLRHLLHFKVVRPPVINLWCGSYSFALPLKIIIWLKGFDPNSRVRCKFNG